MPDFPFKAGDRIRRQGWSDGMYVTVTAVGSEAFLGIYRHPRSREEMWALADGDKPWELYVDPPKRYVVEIRKPKDGEKYIDEKGAVWDHGALVVEVPVIVEELS